MGNYQYKYIVEDFCETPDDVKTFSSNWDISVNPDYVAEDAAQDLFESHDGWEATWPLVFVLFSVTGYKLGRFSVELEHQPAFSAATLDKHIQRASAGIDAPEYDCLDTLGNLTEDQT